ncbi:RagB/SusD family nutrient uptake outer membrane protein [Terrimonas alba]|uniref:RagB/SusD family nutrient uptake outer membrane protein n=1 Tax=Terrimonas alba TaxID=3349636 RepID=UPI0035F25BC6
MEKIKSFLILSLLLTGTFSCKKEFLDETPLDFLSSTNAFKTAADFNASVNNLYRLVRAEFYTVNDNDPMEYQYRTDIAFYVPAAFPANLSGEISPTSGIMERHWRALYKIVSEANTVISRIPASEMSDADKTLFEARGRFFRAFAYRSLAYIWGGVPLVTEEVTEPKVDYVRASRKDVYTQVIEDLTFAVANLPGITTVKLDGEISNLAAQHLLAEVYLADGQFQNAITAASAVIDDPATDLMKARFGTRKNENPGDVYWDLFRRGNQNRKAGNTEAIWVVQIEADVPGGAATTATSFASGDGFSLERVHAPLVRDLTIDNIAAFRWPTSDYTGGRGVGFFAPSKYFIDSVYASDPVNDIRNANHNFVRKFKASNPASPYYNTEIDFHNLPAGTKGTSGAVLTSGVPSRALYPYQTKCTDPGNHPANLYSGAYPMALKGGAGFTYQDQYMFRLAETYLLRAEAQLGAGNAAAAADDINAVRSRSGAAPVSAGDVNIDYILDERIRELGTEEKRLLTLMRLGKWYDRIIKCNPFYASSADPKYNLWPIPQSEIERNRGAVLDQNPGY